MRTFVAVCWLLTAAFVIAVSMVGVSRLPSVPAAVVGLSVASVILLSALVAGFLENGGYEAIGADPNATARFGWLALLYFPVAFVPTLVGLDAFGLTPTVAFAVVVGAAIGVAGWLTTFGGFDRVAFEERHVVHAAGAAVVCFAVGSTIGLLVVPAQFQTPAWTGIGAIAAQIVVLWIGLGGYVDRIRA
ncbi:hypothetical protein [Halovivax gelatinilyticus]|uniref:hypothetical protein n=1 Tax=Halovivax gelatinilyticus TaxID=2961597 RepID=UPI0020CA74A1|nr:hypothetical protein [Halovivax gelatinilyticus]